MSLIACAECGHRISDKAASCPECGHPGPASSEEPAPSCHACSRPATARCESCDTLCCVTHLRTIYVRRRRYGSHESQCDACFARTKESNAVVRGIGWMLLVLIVILFASTLASR